MPVAKSQSAVGATHSFPRAWLRRSPAHRPAQPAMLSLPARLFPRPLQRRERRRRKRSIPPPRPLRVRLEPLHQLVYPRVAYPQQPPEPVRRHLVSGFARRHRHAFCVPDATAGRACLLVYPDRFRRVHNDRLPRTPNHPPAPLPPRNERLALRYEGSCVGSEREGPLAAPFLSAGRLFFLPPPLPHQLLDHPRLQPAPPRQRLPLPRRARLLDVDSPRRLRPLRLVPRPRPSHFSVPSRELAAGTHPPPNVGPSHNSSLICHIMNSLAPLRNFVLSASCRRFAVDYVAAAFTRCMRSAEFRRKAGSLRL